MATACTRAAPFVVVALILALGPASAATGATPSARTCDGLTVAVDPSARRPEAVVTLPLSLTGRRVPASAIRISQGGRDAPVLGLRRVRAANLDVVVVLDNAPGPARRLGAARTAARSLLDALPRRARAGMVPTRGARVPLRALRLGSPPLPSDAGEARALADAVALAAQQLGLDSRRQGHLVVLAGADESSGLERSSVATALSARGVALEVVDPAGRDSLPRATTRCPAAEPQTPRALGRTVASSIADQRRVLLPALDPTAAATATLTVDGVGYSAELERWPPPAASSAGPPGVDRLGVQTLFLGILLGLAGVGILVLGLALASRRGRTGTSSARGATTGAATPVVAGHRGMPARAGEPPRNSTRAASRIRRTERPAPATEAGQVGPARTAHAAPPRWRVGASVAGGDPSAAQPTTSPVEREPADPVVARADATRAPERRRAPSTPAPARRVTAEPAAAGALVPAVQQQAAATLDHEAQSADRGPARDVPAPDRPAEPGEDGESYDGAAAAVERQAEPVARSRDTEVEGQPTVVPALSDPSRLVGPAEALSARAGQVSAHRASTRRLQVRLGTGQADLAEDAPAPPGHRANTTDSDSARAPERAPRRRLEIARAQVPEPVPTEPREAIWASAAGAPRPAPVLRERRRGDFPVVPVARAAAAALVPAVAALKAVVDDDWWARAGADGIAGLAAVGLVTLVGIRWVWVATTPPWALRRQTAARIRAAQDRQELQAAAAGTLMACLRNGGVTKEMWADFELRTGLTVPSSIRSMIDPEMDPAALVRYLVPRQPVPPPAPQALVTVVLVPVCSVLLPAAVALLLL